MLQSAIRLWGHLIRALAYGVFGALLVLIMLFVLYLENRPDLQIWHQAELDAEFTAKTELLSFKDYLALENRLFDQLEKRVYARIQPRDQRLINRYHGGSLSDPKRWSPNWNRSFELTADTPQAGVLLLHGMSDSPYSMANIGRQLHASGAWVVGLRLPGHGTAPSALTDFHWQDMASAVRLAMNHLQQQVGDKPLYIVGYSNGGALAIHYALTRLEEPNLPAISGVALISPSIGVSPMAKLAIWQSRLGNLLGLHKLEWNSILPEYDPFKYGSFAVNAGDQVYRLTSEIREQLDSHSSDGQLTKFPPVLAFQSAIDATVSTPALIEGLMKKLPQGGHELVLFDVNREAELQHLLSNNPRRLIRRLLNDPALPFGLSVLTNEDNSGNGVTVQHKQAGSSAIKLQPLPLEWPADVYSLSHVALPFPKSDPLYGGHNAGDSPGIQLGDIAFRGERDALQIPAGDMLRLRWNPFYPYLEQRLLDFLGLSASAGLPASKHD